MIDTSPAPAFPMPPIPALTPEAEVALLARILCREGYDDHLAGHITYLQPDRTLLVNPFGIRWDEVRASDILRIDLDGNILEGKWMVTPAISLHTELHKARPDTAVALHNHSEWGTVWANMHRVPEVFDQTSAMMPGHPALNDEYDGSVNAVDSARKCVEALGDARCALLANHGVFVLGKDLRQAHQRAVILEWRCRQAWRVEVAGGGVPMADVVFERFSAHFDEVSFPGLWESEVRRELRTDPGVLD